MPVILGYWNIRALGEHIRFLLEYAGEEYIDKRYEFGPAPDYDRKQWLDDKFTLGMDFPNLPYYIDGDIKIAQSSAILRHLARKHNLIADKTEDDIIKTEMLENEAYDLRYHFGYLCFDPEFENLKEEFINKTAPEKFTQFSKSLGDNKWFLGDKITYVDFFIYESLSSVNQLTPETLDKFKNLKHFMNRFESLEPIKNYMKSDRYIGKPYHIPTSNFLNKKM